MPAAVAYSYIRFSSPQQAEGDSERRQTEAAAKWCKKNGVDLDTSTFRDFGMSAFRGKNRDLGALGAFLQLVEDGDGDGNDRVPPGSFLVVEALDRLTRENIQPAMLLVLNLLAKGVRIVQLQPAEVVYDDKSDTTAIILMLVELSRGHSESKVKSERIGAAWDNKKKKARADGTVLTLRLPAWVGVQGAKLVAVPQRVKVIRRMFELTVKGHGLSRIVRELTGTVEPWGRGGTWSKAYVHKILSGRAVLGEYQPRKAGQDGKVATDGEAIAGYYPPVVDPDLWQRAQDALLLRKDRRGAEGKKVAALFGGLLWDARTGQKMHVAWQTRGVKDKSRCRRRVLVPAGSMEGRTKTVSFPNDVFEEAVLTLLREINPADVLGEEPASESAVLAAKLAAKEQRRREVREAMTEGNGDMRTLTEAGRKLDADCHALAEQLAEAQRKERQPRGVAWAEMRTLLDAAHDEATRLRLRDLLRVNVENVHVLVVPRRSHRLCAVQVNFMDGVRRSYLIHYRAAGFCREGGWSARSFALPAAGADAAPLDLRRPADARLLEAKLSAIDIAALAGEEQPNGTPRRRGPGRRK
jgi:DNA invertase Pin-like site-specific DNA recombinase